MMVANNLFTDQVTGEVWMVDKALLEVTGGHRNIVLLVRNHDVPCATDTIYKVVFDGKMVSGDWYLESAGPNGGTEHLMIKFHFTGNDNKAKWHRYAPVAGTLAWSRMADNRIFIEIVDLQAAQQAAGTDSRSWRAAASSTGRPSAAR